MFNWRKPLIFLFFKKNKTKIAEYLDVRFQFPQDIPPSRSGKTLYTISNIQ